MLRRFHTKVAACSMEIVFWISLLLIFTTRGGEGRPRAPQRKIGPPVLDRDDEHGDSCFLNLEQEGWDSDVAAQLLALWRSAHSRDQLFGEHSAYQICLHSCMERAHRSESQHEYVNTLFLCYKACMGLGQSMRTTSSAPPDVTSVKMAGRRTTVSSTEHIVGR